MHDFRSKELGSVNFLSLFNCQGSVLEAGEILPAALQLVKAFSRQKTDISNSEVGTSDQSSTCSGLWRRGVSL